MFALENPAYKTTNKHYVAICTELVYKTLKTTTRKVFACFQKSDFQVRIDAHIYTHNIWYLYIIYSILLHVYSVLFDSIGKIFH